MYCGASDHERNVAAAMQMLAALTLFLPGLVARRTRLAARSPYLRYWAKASVVWSTLTAILLAGAIACALWFDTLVAVVVVGTLHVMFCVMGAFGAMFDTPFRYAFVGRLFCSAELACLWYDPRIRGSVAQLATRGAPAPDPAGDQEPMREPAVDERGEAKGMDTDSAESERIYPA